MPIDFAPVEKAFFDSGKTSLMTVLKNGDRWDKSNVAFNDGELLEYNKKNPKPNMAYIDYGLGVLHSSVLDSYPTKEAFDLAEVYHALSLQGQLAGYEMHDRFYEIGSHNGLNEAEDYFLTKEKL